MFAEHRPGLSLFIFSLRVLFVSQKFFFFSFFSVLLIIHTSNRIKKNEKRKKKKKLYITRLEFGGLVHSSCWFVSRQILGNSIIFPVYLLKDRQVSIKRLFSSCLTKIKNTKTRNNKEQQGTTRNNKEQQGTTRNNKEQQGTTS
jgi:hypothetical protein